MSSRARVVVLRRARRKVYCNGDVGKVAQEIYSAVTDIQYERADDEFNWLVEVPEAPSVAAPLRSSVDVTAAGLYTGTTDAQDPMEAFCAKDPAADECRVYED
jgi:hypothetical protein